MANDAHVTANTKLVQNSYSISSKIDPTRIFANYNFLLQNYRLYGILRDVLGHKDKIDISYVYLISGERESKYEACGPSTDDDDWSFFHDYLARFDFKVFDAEDEEHTPSVTIRMINKRISLAAMRNE